MSLAVHWSITETKLKCDTQFSITEEAVCGTNTHRKWLIAALAEASGSRLGGVCWTIFVASTKGDSGAAVNRLPTHRLPTHRLPMHRLTTHRLTMQITTHELLQMKTIFG